MQETSSCGSPSQPGCGSPIASSSPQKHFRVRAWIPSSQVALQPQNPDQAVQAHISFSSSLHSQSFGRSQAGTEQSHSCFGHGAQSLASQGALSSGLSSSLSLSHPLPHGRFRVRVPSSPQVVEQGPQGSQFPLSQAEGQTPLLQGSSSASSSSPQPPHSSGDLPSGQTHSRLLDLDPSPQLAEHSDQGIQSPVEHLISGHSSYW